MRGLWTLIVAAKYSVQSLLKKDCWVVIPPSADDVKHRHPSPVPTADHGHARLLNRDCCAMLSSGCSALSAYALTIFDVLAVICALHNNITFRLCVYSSSQSYEWALIIFPFSCCTTPQSPQTPSDTLSVKCKWRLDSYVVLPTTPLIVPETRHRILILGKKVPQRVRSDQGWPHATASQRELKPQACAMKSPAASPISKIVVSET